MQITRRKKRSNEFRIIVKQSDLESIDKSLEAMKMLIDNGHKNMAEKISKMLKQEFPNVPEEIFDISDC